MASSSTDRFQELIRYRFTRPERLLEALTHSSYAREVSGDVRDNEQLEFLGDAVLGFVVSFKLADAFPEHSEGKLSRARARLVAADNLGKAAARLELGTFLRLGRGEEKTGGRFKARLAVNALEALVAAIYLDGGLPAAERFISHFILPGDLVGAKDELFTVDYKSALQEHLQAVRRGVASYTTVSESGPEHRKTFVVEAGALEQVARGRGENKKVAEQEAARKLLELLEGEYAADE